MEEFDVVVVGAGPAGATTALCLARTGWRVALITSALANQHPVGETLPPEISPILTKLGLWDSFLSQGPLESPGTISIWGSAAPSEVDFTLNPFGCGWHVDRRGFDEMLQRQAVNVGVRIYEDGRKGCRRESLQSGDGWLIGRLQARILVDATGRNGMRLDDFVEREREDALLAFVVQIAHQETSLDRRTCIESTPSGWWYSTLLPGGGGIAMFFTGAEVYRGERISISDQLRSAPFTQSRLHRGSLSGTRIVYVQSGYRKRIFGDNWVAVGDSASSYDPLSGRGIFKAFMHAQIAAQAIDAGLRGDREAVGRYAAQVTREFEDYARQRKKYYSFEQRWPNHPFWRGRRDGLH